MTTEQLELVAQNQLLIAAAIFLFLLFFRAAEQHEKAKQAAQSHYLTDEGYAGERDKQSAAQS